MKHRSLQKITKNCKKPFLPFSLSTTSSRWSHFCVIWNKWLTYYVEFKLFFETLQHPDFFENSNEGLLWNECLNFNLWLIFNVTGTGRIGSDYVLWTSSHCNLKMHMYVFGDLDKLLSKPFLHLNKLQFFLGTVTAVILVWKLWRKILPSPVKTG